MSFRTFGMLRYAGLAAAILLIPTLIGFGLLSPIQAQEHQSVEASGIVPTPSGPQPIANGPTPQPTDIETKPGEEKKPEAKEGEKKPDEATDKSPKKEEPKGPIKRKDEPEEPADPDELKVRPDERGMVRLNFRGQAWPDVLVWLADISHTSLDWQELPSDYLNLTTQRPYTVDEVRDMLNERLISRGYTILKQQEGLVIAKLEGLNAARVPRVHPEDLRFCDDHEFVKVSFPLSWLMAEDAIEELKPMLSKHGTMSALSTSNRLEILDMANVLRDVQHVLMEEQSSEVRSTRVHEFFLRYTRAEDVLSQLESLLGIRKAGGSMGAMNPQMMQQMQQMQQQMMQQMQQQQQQGGAKRSRRPSGQDDIHLVINSRQNSILANAPPDKLVIIAEAVKRFDVPQQPGSAIGGSYQRVQVYRLAQLKPQALQSILLQSGNLDPSTQLVIDDKNRALIANASPADQITIQAVIEKLDGTGRQFKVIRLRRLQADYVAGSIRFMMGEEEDKNKNNSRRSYYSYYGYGGQQNDDEDKDKFRVDADVVNNRLLLWANDVELDAIENLLVQLGEIPAGGNAQRGRLRTMELGSADSAEDLIKRLKEVWPQVSPAPLQIETSKPDSTSKDVSPGDTQPQPTEDNAAKAKSMQKVPIELAAVFTEPEAASEDDSDPIEILTQDELKKRYFTPASPQTPQSGKKAPPVVVQVDENGRITLASEDPTALDLLEDILLDMKPEPKEWHVFQLKYASALWVSWNLEDFFEEKEEEDKSNDSPFWFWDYGREEKKEDPLRLSQRKKLKFLPDSDTGTIVVQNANADQLKTIEELIELYDKPEPVVEQSKRINATYEVRYSKASAIAESVKDVFRDLLSANDKSLQQQQQKDRGGDRGKEPDRYSSNLPFQTGSSFKGKLSIGVDDISNTLLISTEGDNLMTLVMDMVKRIDEAAQPVSTVRVVNLRTGVGGDKMRELLKKLLEDAKKQQQKQQQQQNPNGQPNMNQQPGMVQPNNGNPQEVEVQN